MTGLPRALSRLKPSRMAKSCRPVLFLESTFQARIDDDLYPDPPLRPQQTYPFSKDIQDVVHRQKITGDAA